MTTQKKYTDLKEFLRCHKTIPEKTFTHTALGQPPHSYPGSYSIDDEELSLFGGKHITPITFKPKSSTQLL